MNAIYFWEVNCISIVILGLLLKQLRSTLQSNTMDMIILRRIMWTDIILCLADAISGSLSGKGHSDIINNIVHAGNIVYFIALVFIGYFWLQYVNIRLRLSRDLSHKKSLLAKVPVIITVCVILLNPITEFMFSVDIDNTYQRENGIILHWIVLWGYIGYSTVKTAMVMLKESNKYCRREIRAVLCFAIAPIIASFIQMVVPGTTITQVGILLSTIIVFLDIQQNQIVTDVLTGLNNRHGLQKFIYNTISFSENSLVYALLLDLNGFKQINDSYGHMVGDDALQEVANLLKITVREFHGKIYLSRIGGDEFTILMYQCTEEDVQLLYHNILVAFDERNLDTKEQYMLTTSIGLASGMCVSSNDVEALLVEADKNMYQYKKELKRGYV